MYCVCVCVCYVCCCVCVCARARAHTYTYNLLLFVSLFLFILSVTSFVSISLCMHVIWYNTKHTHTHTHTGSRIHLWALFSRRTSSSNVIFSRANRGIGSQPREAPRSQANGQRHAQYLLDLWLQGIVRKQLTNHLRHALWRKPSMMLRESTMTFANFS